LKRGWMRFWRSGRVALMACLVGSAVSSCPARQSSVALRRANERTLAGLRPGKDTVDRAKAKYKEQEVGKPVDTWLSWIDTCRGQLLSVKRDGRGKIQTVRAESFPYTADCKKVSPSKWRTGRGLAIHATTASVIQLYGQPDSRSPSPKDEQQLELLHYSFDWAGPDVPQTMDVLCTLETDGKPGRVVEIKLAAPNL
jgi:hypothetical protein